jgi:long-subunit fatty acid transport protein
MLKSLPLALLFTLFPLLATAEGLRNPPPGAFALSRLGGKLAHVDDASAVFVNPANLLDLESTSILISPALIDIDRDVDADWGGSAGTIENLKVLGGLFAAFPGTSDRFAWGIGISAPYGSPWSTRKTLRSSTWPLTSPN